MDGSTGEKSRRERRKEARLAKNKKKFDSWVHHQKSSKLRKSIPNTTHVIAKKLEINEPSAGMEENLLRVPDTGVEGPSLAKNKMVKRKKSKTTVIEGGPSQAKKKMVKSKKSKTNFDEYIEWEMRRGNIPAEEDLMLEKKLAKKLKVKKGKLGGMDDDLGALLEGIPSVLDSMDEDDAVTNSFENRENVSDEEVESEMESVSEVEDSHMSDASTEEQSEELTTQKSVRNERKRTRKTNFEKYRDLEESQKGAVAANEDIELEKKLAKKLKVKSGKFQADNDGMNGFLMGIPSVLESLEGSGTKGTESDPVKNLDGDSLRKLTTTEAPEQDPAQGTSQTQGTSEQAKDAGKAPKLASGWGSGTKYVAPHLRAGATTESEEHVKIRKRIRGLLNRLSESNVESITGEISTIFHGVGRTAGFEIIGHEVLSSCAGGPRGNEQYAATFAAFVAGMACSVGIDFGAKLLAALAKYFEMEYLQEDNLSLRNLTLLLSYLYIFGICTSDLLYDFMTMLSKRLTEVDVSTILTILQTCGMKLRGDHPVGMKNFIQSVQLRVNELKAPSAGDGQANMSGKRMEFMLETICDIKNNKKKPKEETVQHTRIKKWLQKLRVEDVLVRVMKWCKLLDPDKKGQWWLSGDAQQSTEKLEEVASKIDSEVNEAQKLLQLAAAQRMNTDARRAIFCVIMSGEDFKDAFTKLLGLDLQGKQDREIMRVLVECCLQEKVFNKYYTILGYKLCKHNKNHKFTLQYCLWDHYKELETMTLIRSMHLAKFTAEMIASFSLSLAVLKVVDLGDPGQLTPKRIMHFRMLFEAIFGFPDKVIWNAFSRIAVTPEYESLRIGIKFFVSKYVISSQNNLEPKYKIAKQALKNVKGQLL
ncbi:OLC1v1033931C2 [Oldenlandia corymbosa var. corymbosa]|uniref:OLC1v1033931C2 n=1 Tax=Oldenlandia corymbosa var. corymbosa TaxID=529605 RepID=A0AAV1CQ36_OLDCO|nr:OLC1v1033931C2 [Oldenlandia corymbosa var. corymbosa]